MAASSSPKPSKPNGSRKDERSPSASGSREKGPGASGSNPKRPKRNSGRMRSGTREAIQAHREKLGLSEMQPSQKIRGLADVEARAAKQEQRERARKAAGGGINKVDALQIGEVGHRWSRMVMFGIAGIIGFVVMVLILMHWISNRTVIDHEEAKRDTKNRLSRYANLYAPRMKPFDADDYVSDDKFKDALKVFLENELKELEKVAEIEKQGGQVAFTTLEKIRRTKGDLTLKDAWGDPLVFDTEGDDTALIKSRRRSVKPVTFPIPRRKR